MRVPAVLPFLRRMAFAGSELLFPRRCYLCGVALPEEPDPDCVCLACHAALVTDPHASCPRCAATVGPHADTSDGCPACRAAKFPFESAVRFGPYDNTLRDGIVRAKLPGGEGLAETLGRVWAAARRAELAALPVDVIVPVPLHWRRRWARGFNQTAAVARGLSAVLGWPVRTGALRRVRNTPKQYGQTRTERQRNVDGAFAPAGRLTGLRVLLLDDVFTTGATLAAAARAVRDAGATAVTVAVLARR